MRLFPSMVLGITSASSCSAFIEHARYGCNRGHERLPQANMLLAVGETSGMPIFFEALDGALKDASALENALLAIGWMGIKRPHSLLDRGFYSEKNIGGLYSKRFKSTLGAASTANWPNGLVAAARGSIEDCANFHRLGGYSFFAITGNTKWKGKRCCRHVCYGSQQAASGYASFLVHLDTLRAELEAGTSAAPRGGCGRCFVAKDTPKRGRRATVRQEEVDAFKENRAGFFVIISNIVKYPVPALKLYRGKDVAEKNFDNQKNALDMKRLRAHSRQAKALGGEAKIQPVWQNAAYCFPHGASAGAAGGAIEDAASRLPATVLPGQAPSLKSASAGG